jgi:hypothetical protein
MIFLTIVGLIMFIGSVLYFIGVNIPVDEPPYFQIVFGFFTIALLPFSIYRAGKKNFSSHGRLQEKITYEFTDEKIRQTGETFNSDMDWTKIYKVQELKEWILIYQNTQIANLIPKESFGDNLQEFRELVKRKGIKAKLRN